MSGVERLQLCQRQKSTKHFLRSIGSGVERGVFNRVIVDGRPRVALQDVSFTVGKGEIVGGRAVELVGPIPGSGASEKFRWVVVGDAGSTVTITASSPVAGSASAPVTLR